MVSWWNIGLLVLGIIDLGIGIFAMFMAFKAWEDHDTLYWRIRDLEKRVNQNGPW